MLKLLCISLIALFLHACSGNETDTHTHEDGTTHEAHEVDESHSSESHQEEFTLDTTRAAHDHEHGIDHSHNDGHQH